MTRSRTRLPILLGLAALFVAGPPLALAILVPDFYRDTFHPPHGGGTRLIYRVDAPASAQPAFAAVGDAAGPIRDRLAELSVDASVIPIGDRLHVELSPVAAAELEAARRFIQRDTRVEIRRVDATGRLHREVELTGTSIQHASVSWNSELNRPEVLVELDAPGAARLAQLTAEHIGEKIAIVVDGRVVAAPVIGARIDDGRLAVSTSGGDARAMQMEAQDLAATLRSRGAPLVLDSETRIASVDWRRLRLLGCAGAVTLIGLGVVLFLARARASRANPPRSEPVSPDAAAPEAGSDAP